MNIFIIFGNDLMPHLDCHRLLFQLIKKTEKENAARGFSAKTSSPSLCSDRARATVAVEPPRHCRHAVLPAPAADKEAPRRAALLSSPHSPSPFFPASGNPNPSRHGCDLAEVAVMHRCRSSTPEFKPKPPRAPPRRLLPPRPRNRDWRPGFAVATLSPLPPAAALRA